MRLPSTTKFSSQQTKWIITSASTSPPAVHSFILLLLSNLLTILSYPLTLPPYLPPCLPLTSSTYPPLLLSNLYQSHGIILVIRSYTVVEGRRGNHASFRIFLFCLMLYFFSCSVLFPLFFFILSCPTFNCHFFSSCLIISLIYLFYFIVFFTSHDDTSYVNWCLVIFFLMTYGVMLSYDIFIDETVDCPTFYHIMNFTLDE